MKYIIKGGRRLLVLLLGAGCLFLLCGCHGGGDM